MRKPKTAPKPAPQEPEPYLLGYARVSTEEQNLDMQLQALRRAGVRDDNLFVEKVSTRKAKRQMLDRLIDDIRPGDTVVVWKLDRIARSRADLYKRLDDIAERGAGLKSLTENFDFSSAIGKLVLGVFVLIAEFERDLISARTSAGMQAFKARGGKLGRKPVLDEAGIAKAERLLNEGVLSKAAVGREVGVSPTTINNYFTYHSRKPHWRRVKK